VTDDRELQRRTYQRRLDAAEKHVADAVADIRSLVNSDQITRSGVNLASRAARLAAAVAWRNALRDAAPLID
jgi:predicted DNA-binding protein (UPF0251 family)